MTIINQKAENSNHLYTRAKLGTDLLFSVANWYSFSAMSKKRRLNINIHTGHYVVLEKKSKLRNMYFLHNWINKLVPRTMFEARKRWQGPPNVNKLKLCCSLKVCLGIEFPSKPIYCTFNIALFFSFITHHNCMADPAAPAKMMQY